MRILLLLCALLLPLASPALAAHGISLDGTLKYPADFKGFDYTSPDAKPGGTLNLHAIGSFDKMNPFTLKGSHPDLLSPLVFEHLMVQSMDEPFSQYGLLAQSVEVAEDGLSVTFHLDPEARFSDESPVTAEDVKFSLETLQSDKAHPFHQSYWRDIVAAEVLSPRSIRFTFRQTNRELPLIAGEIPVLSRAFFTKHPFGEEKEMVAPLGTGPYVVEEFSPGKIVTYRRNPKYWGNKRPVNRGLHSFERIVLKFYKDPVVALEGFKAGEFDFMHENNSKQWARDYEGPKFVQKLIKKETLGHKRGAGMQGLIFNLRRPFFQDIRVRKAMSLAFDFEWSNDNLFHGQYTRSTSYFSNSEMAATGSPPPEELALLEPLRDKLDPAVFGPVQAPPSTTPPNALRQNLKEATKLLKEAGWSLGPDKILTDGKGNRLEIEILLATPAFERILAPYAANLEKLGIALKYRTVDTSLYQSRVHDFDYDMIVNGFGQSQSPGNEQRDMWHSESAPIKGSHNRIGIQDPAVDALVEKIIRAKNRKDLVTACRALDRVLLAGHYLVPNWHLNYHRIAYWDRFARPATAPLYYQPEDWLLSWWMK
ncbi:MAG: ABC transporter substrate-binding protein [Magnetococcales bacterium]|nr:ABC transporter substrate-binding protein [Magnetococcales bacterium]MBF0262659.1 ABC transporter substrate-binding protein [Magnetococcales bacterium]